jgi:enoyl-[acyl-carrier protein] reductase II
MYPEVPRTYSKATTKPLVNVPMLYPNIEEIMKIIVDEGVKIVFTSAGILRFGLLFEREWDNTARGE